MDFFGVNRRSHLAALERFYKAHNPTKVDQIQMMFDKLGDGIWAALAEKYPGVRSRPHLALTLCGS